GCRSAQPPANCSNPSGINHNRLMSSTARVHQGDNIMKASKPAKTYRNLQGQMFFLDLLPPDERKLIAAFQAKAKQTKDWATYKNYWLSKIKAFYERRGLTRPQIMQTPGYLIGQDLGSRMAVEQGWARPPDYRDELESIIQQRFKTRREFCEATGLSEDMLSHVLARRKHLAVSTLEESLRRIGYSLRITPLAQS